MTDGGSSEPAAIPPRRRTLWTRIFRSHDFARDITVTTLGVLIALGIGEIVEEIRWKLRVDATTSAIRDELGLLRAVYLSELVLKPCTARRITELDELIGEARRTGRLPRIANIAYPPNFGSYGDSWALATGTEIPLKMQPHQVLRLATLWANEDIHANLVDRQRDAFDRLLIMENRPGPISDGRILQLESELVSIKNATDGILFIAGRDSVELGRDGIKAMFAPGEPLNLATAKRELAKRSLCQPMIVDGQAYRMKGRSYEPRKPVSGA